MILLLVLGGILGDLLRPERVSAGLWAGWRGLGEQDEVCLVLSSRTGDKRVVGDVEEDPLPRQALEVGNVGGRRSEKGRNEEG